MKNTNRKVIMQIKLANTIKTKKELEEFFIAVIGQTGINISQDDIRDSLEYAIARYGGC